MKPLREIMPEVTRKVRITIRLDADVVRWFKEQVEAMGGGNYQPLINAALREHIERQKESLEDLLRRVIREELRAPEGGWGFVQYHTRPLKSNIHGLTTACSRRANSCARLPPGRVCRAWHRASEVQVLAPSVRAAEGEEKGKDVTARWGLEEAPSKDAGRRTGTGEKVWYTRDERARDRKVLHTPWGGRDKSGVYASPAQCLTPGDLYAVCGSGVRVKPWALTGLQQSAEGIVCAGQQRAQVG
jgi:hypothetical protein